MQSDEQNNPADSLENLQYTNSGQVVLDSGLSEQNRVFGQTAMGELKRPLPNDDDDDDADSAGSPLDQKPAKKTRGRVKIDMKFITNKLRRYTTFSKRKTGIMKKVSLFSLFSVENIHITSSFSVLLFFLIHSPTFLL